MRIRVQIIQHICECLVDLHDSGYVHRDLKPGNIMWLPTQNRWTLIDFGCAVRIGEQARMGFSLMYAAPEVLRACYREGQKAVMAAPALDVWSLGIIAVELFSGGPAFGAFTTAEQVRKHISCSETPSCAHYRYTYPPCLF